MARKTKPVGGASASRGGRSAAAASPATPAGAKGRPKGVPLKSAKKSASASKTPKLLELIMAMQGGRPQTAAQLAGRLKITVRTLHRYLKDLSAANVPYFNDRESGGYRIRADFFLPPLQLTLGEATALALLCEKVGETSGITNLRQATAALEKIESSLPPALRSEVREVCKRVEIRTAPGEYRDESGDTHRAVREAITSGVSLKCRYEPARPGAEAEEFEFEPYALFFSVRAWYTVGKHSKRKGLRSLKLVRFERAEPTGRRYTIPAGFTLEKHIGNAWRMMRGETEHDVALRFDADFAQGITETLWHHTQNFHNNDDGSVTLTCRVAGLDEIVWWVLGMGPHCRVIEPVELRDRVRVLAERTAAVQAGA